MHDASPGSGSFAQLLTELQRRTGLSDQGIAEVAGVNRSQVWRWIHSGSAPGYEPVRRIAAHLIAERPDLADDAAALLPAAGYRAPGAVAAPPRDPADDPAVYVFPDDPAAQAMFREAFASHPVVAAIWKPDRDPKVKAAEIRGWLTGKAKAEAEDAEGRSATGLSLSSPAARAFPET